jgi:hypothetical protein
VKDVEALIIFFVAFVLLDISATLWGADSRDANDWYLHPRP